MPLDQHEWLNLDTDRHKIKVIQGLITRLHTKSRKLGSVGSKNNFKILQLQIKIFLDFNLWIEELYQKSTYQTAVKTLFIFWENS